MQKIGISSSGAIIVEMTESEFEEISAPDIHGKEMMIDIDSIRDNYKLYPALVLLSAIFGTKKPEQMDVVEYDYYNIFMIRMTVAICSLPEHERKVLELHYGLVDGVKHKISDIDQQLGYNPGTALSLKNKGIRKLRHPNRSRALRNYTVPPNNQNKADA